jgi:carboxyl-terminal processing protease
MKKYKRPLIGVFVIFVFFFLWGGRKIFLPHKELKKEYQYIKLFSEVVFLVKNNYVEAVNAVDKFPGAFSGMLSALDPFSAYLDPQKTEIYQSLQAGKYYGSGINGAKRMGYFYISDVEPGSPADEAGLKPGDMIKAVNGESIYSHAFWEMRLSLLSTEPRDITVTLLKTRTRDAGSVKFRTKPTALRTTVETVEKNILLVKLTRFDPPAAALLKKHLKAGKKPLKLIIDLRKYAGGDFDSFKKIVPLFFKKPLLLTLKLKDKDEDFLLGSETLPQYKAAVIINRSTQMYGELLAAFFKQSGAPSQRPVTLVGTRTQGFISKLRSIPMEDGSSILVTEGLFHLGGNPTASKPTGPDIVVKDKESGEIIKKCISILNSPVHGNSFVEKNGKKKKT